jgi:hypothetical protein
MFKRGFAPLFYFLPPPIIIGGTKGVRYPITSQGKGGSEGDKVEKTGEEAGVRLVAFVRKMPRRFAF